MWLTTILILAALPARLHADLARAEALYQRTEYQQALQQLDLAAQDPNALLLAGKAYFRMDDYRKSVEVLERAVKLRPDSSEINHWLGKAYGRTAEKSSLLTAAKWASRCRQQFEKAVELDPKNTAALSDLFQYYFHAPGIMGGGTDKAQRTAQRLATLDPAEGHFAESMLAEKRGDFAAAERHLRQAMAEAPKDPGRVIDLAKFLARRGRLAESDAAFEAAAKLGDPPKLLFERAAVYLETKRNAPDARRLLEEYLRRPLTPDDPTRAEARSLLKKAGGA